MQKDFEDEDEQIDYSPSKDEIIEYAKYLGMNIEQDQKYLYIAEEGQTYLKYYHKRLTAPLPEGWKEYITPEGEIYYYNQFTQLSQWEHPSDEFYKQKYLNQKEKDTKNRLSMQDFVESDIKKQQKPLTISNANQIVTKITENSQILTQCDNKMDQAQSQMKLQQTPISQGRHTPKQEYYDLNQEDIEERVKEYEIKMSQELKEAISNIEQEFEQKKAQLQQQVDKTFQQFIKTWEETNLCAISKNKDIDQIDVQSEKEQIYKQIQINFNEQKIMQENKLHAQFDEIKQKIKRVIGSKYENQINKLENEKRQYDDIVDNKSFLSISQRNINSALIQEQQKMKSYYDQQIQHLKNQGMENLKFAVQDYKSNLNIQLQQKRQQKLREMKEKIDLSNEQKKDQIRKELIAEFEQRQYNLKKQFVIEEKALEQQEKIKIEADYSSEVSQIELKYTEDLQKIKESEELNLLKKQERLQKKTQEIKQKYDDEEKEVTLNLERKIQTLEDELLDLQDKLNTKKLYSKRYKDLKKLEDQINQDIKEKNQSVRQISEQMDSEKKNISLLQTQVQEKLQFYQKLINEQKQLNLITTEQQEVQERREQMLVEKMNEMKDQYNKIIQQKIAKELISQTQTIDQHYQTLPVDYQQNQILSKEYLTIPKEQPYKKNPRDSQYQTLQREYQVKANAKEQSYQTIPKEKPQQNSYSQSIDIQNQENILRGRDPNVDKRPAPVYSSKHLSEDEDESSTLSKEKQKLKQLKKKIEQKIVDLNKNNIENYYINKYSINQDDDSYSRKKYSLIDKTSQYKRNISYDRAYQSFSQQGFYQDSKRQLPQNNQSLISDKYDKEDQVLKLKLQLELLKNQVSQNEEKKTNSIQQKQSINQKNRDLSLEDFTNKKINHICQGLTQQNRFGDSSRQQSQNQSIQSSKNTTYTFMQSTLRKDWRTILALEQDKIRLEQDGLRKDQQLLTHQIQLAKDEVKNLKKGYNDIFMSYDISVNLQIIFIQHTYFDRYQYQNRQNTVKNAEKVLKEKVKKLENDKIDNQKKELEINQRRRIIDNMQIRLETIQTSEEDDELDAMYDDYKTLQIKD